MSSLRPAAAVASATSRPHGSACPGQTDGIMICSWYQCRSEPQMPQLRTRTRTSPGPGVGRGTSSTTSRPTPRQKAARMAGTRASYSGAATRATPGHRERVLLEPSLGLPNDRVAERRAGLVGSAGGVGDRVGGDARQGALQILVLIVLLSLASITLVVAVTQAFPGRKPCARLCASAVAECTGSCRRAVADCRQSACAALSGRPARACRRGCRRPCKRECRTSILGACRLDGDRTRCDQPPSTTSTTTTTTTSTTLTDKTDWATYGFDLERTSHNPREVTLGADNVGRLGQIWST